MLESMTHDSSCFVTLTYRDNEVPDGHTLDPAHTQKWIKRLRRSIKGKIRFFVVGEYGDETERPHYHAALFGYANCEYGRTRMKRKYCCEQCELVKKTWKHGSVMLGSLTMDSAEYVAKYTTKKMTSMKDERLKGRYPEFARMSNRPGIGARYADEVAENIIRLRLASSLDDVPNVYHTLGKARPVGRYLKERMRKGLGREQSTPESVKEAHAKKMRQVYENQVVNAKAVSLREALLNENEAVVQRMSGLQRFYRRESYL